MDVDAAEVTAPVKSFVDRQFGEVLISEDDDFLLGNQEGKLIFGFVVELAQLNAAYFGTDRSCDVGQLGAWLEEILERRVCVLAMLDMLEWFERLVSRKAATTLVIHAP